MSTKAPADRRPFRFKQFEVYQDKCIMKVGTDSVLLGAWSEVTDVRHALDIGAGSGIIALMLAQRAPSAQIDAVEIDRASWEQAAENMKRSPWMERLQAIHAPIQEFARQHSGEYELIVSNPPFFSGGVLSANHSRNEVRHTIKLPSGDLLRAVRSLLAEKGRFCLILPYLEGLRFVELAETYTFFCTRMTEVHSRPGKPVERLLLQFEFEEKPLQKDGLYLRGEEENSWTSAYRQLTGDFYLDM